MGKHKKWIAALAICFHLTSCVKDNKPEEKYYEGVWEYDYRLLFDFRLELELERSGFSMVFWANQDSCVVEKWKGNLEVADQILHFESVEIMRQPGGISLENCPAELNGEWVDSSLTPRTILQYGNDLLMLEPGFTGVVSETWIRLE